MHASYDLVVFGATSFVGKILCRHLSARHGTDGASLHWAIAGRSQSKLNALTAELGPLDTIVADAHSVNDMDALAASAKVVVSTVGPYALYGSELVRACAQAGTDYCDLTGEPQWMRVMIDDYGDVAASSGARIVHACGFDSIPSDMGVWFTQREAIERYGEPCTKIAMRVKAMKGGASGGTIASMVNALDEVRQKPELRKVLTNPYTLAPDGMRSGVRQPNVNKPTQDAASGAWAAPFVMASVNTKIVHRSHALLGHPWSADFLYDEAMLVGEGPVGMAKAAAVSGGLGGFMAGMAFGPSRTLLSRFLPEPGEGPTPEQQRDGYFDIRFFGTTKSGSEIVTKVTGQGDPGYGSTAKMLGEAAVVLVNTHGVGDGGFLTPATAFAEPLFAALTSNADIGFSVLAPTS